MNLASEYTFDKKSGRKAFGKKRISNVIKVAVQWRFVPPADATDANINKRIGRWLTEPKDSRVPSKCPLHEEVFVRRIKLFKIILVLSDVISNLFSFCSWCNTEYNAKIITFVLYIIYSSLTHKKISLK
jgi:hypothetical protein